MFSPYKDIGVIGGAGPEAGILLTKQIIKISQEHYSCQRDKDFPYIALFSFPFSEMLQYEDSSNVTIQLKELIQKECSQTRLWAIACNTLHCYLESIELPNTFINILEETGKAIIEKPLVLCSSTSKKHEIHKRYFDCDYPQASVQTKIDQLIDHLVAGEPKYYMYEIFQSLVNILGKRQIVLGCTEFSLLHHAFPIQGNIIDPLQIAAKKLCSLHFGEKNV